MRIEIDQSNKVEKTEKDTIIALSNEVTFSARIPRQTKRRLQREFRKRGKPGLFVYRTFMAGVVLLLREVPFHKFDAVTIDHEYLGQERLLRSMFLEMWARDHEDIPEIRFAAIGKHSPAHSVAYRAMKGKQPVGKTLELRELRRLALR